MISRVTSPMLLVPSMVLVIILPISPVLLVPHLVISLVHVEDPLLGHVLVRMGVPMISVVTSQMLSVQLMVPVIILPILLVLLVPVLVISQDHVAGLLPGHVYE